MAAMRFPCALLVVFCVVLCGQGKVARAEDVYRTIDASSPQEVVNGMANKAGRGLANMTTGWLELPKQIYVTSKEDGIPQGILLGPLKGLGMTVARTVAGVGEFLTFFAAYPGFYDPYFDPAYV
ncbi:MAG TPA: exosortase system-associated protein, TIGR04073 family, partial [Geobacteraceae bacterium]